MASAIKEENMVVVVAKVLLCERYLKEWKKRPGYTLVKSERRKVAMGEGGE